MELKLLTTFVKAANLKSFSKAAAELNYTQAAVTIQIQQLEEELQVRLFERFSKSIALTEQGELFLVYANEILQTCEIAKTMLRSEEVLQGTLRIGIIESLCSSLFLDFVKEFHQDHPHIRLQIVTDSPDTLLDMLNHNKLDIVYIIDKKRYHKNWIKTMETQEEIVFVCAPSHPLASCSSLLLKDILKEPLLLTEPGASYRDELEQLVYARGLRFSCALEIGNTSFLSELVKQNMGVSFLPYFAVEKDIKENSLVCLQPKDAQIHVYRQLLYHKSKWLTSQMKAFLYKIQNEG